MRSGNRTDQGAAFFALERNNPLYFSLPVLFFRLVRYYPVYVPDDRYTRNDKTEENKMLILIAVLVFGVLVLAGTPRLAATSEADSRKKVRAYVDGKPVDSYVKEESRRV